MKKTTAKKTIRFYGCIYFILFFVVSRDENASLDVNYKDEYVGYARKKKKPVSLSAFRRTKNGERGAAIDVRE